MEKTSKWYQSIQVLFNFAEKYGDEFVNDDEELAKIYYAAKAEAQGKSKFVQDLLVDFLHEKRREFEK